MTELEVLLVIALVFMLYMYRKVERRAVFFKCSLVAVGKGEITVELDEANSTFQIKPTKKFIESLMNE